MDREAQSHLPFPLAYVWRDLEQWAEKAQRSEDEAVLGLYHLLDAVEVCAKFLAALSLAEADAAGVEFPVPERTWLGERPTLGTWLAVLGHTERELAKGPGPLVVGRLNAAVSALKSLVFAPIVPPEVPAKDLRSLRNWVAHGGVPVPSVAAEILVVGHDAFASFLTTAADVFSGLVLAYVDAQGSPVEVIEEDEGSSELAALVGADAGLYVGAEARWLQIWPIVRHAPAGKGGPDAARRLVTQVFVRLQAGVAEYATLDQRSVAGWGQLEAAAYRRRFTELAQMQGGFWAEIDESAQGLVGRSAELDTIRAALEEGRRGGARRWWLSGPLGQGKSALAARATVEAQVEAEERGEVVIAHFFRTADPRCNLRAFVAQALDALGIESVLGDLKKDAATLRALLAERSVVVFCDGLDELESATSREQVEDLFELARVGGTWLFAGRPHLDDLATRAGLSTLFEGGLGPMGLMDLRALVVNQAPQPVRDAIVLQDAPNAAGDLENPYVIALAERAKGLPLYVVLMLEWLASSSTSAQVKGRIVEALDDPGTLPVGLDALYAQLVEDWGLGVLATIKTFLLCLLCGAAEPLDTESIAALCFGGFLLAPATEAEHEGNIARCHEVLSVFAPVLRWANDGDGRPGWRIFHDSFLAFLSNPLNKDLSPVFQIAQHVLGEFGADPDKAHHEPLRRHLYRHGISYLRADRKNREADGLLKDFDYLYRRLACLGTFGVEELLGDLTQSENADVGRWGRFLGTTAHFLRRRIPGWGPERSLHQLAYDASDPELVSQAKAWSEDHGLPALYRSAGSDQTSAEVIVLEGHTGSVRGALELRDGRLLSWSSDDTLRLWDSTTGACSTVLDGHPTAVRGALELRDGRLISWSALRLWDLASGSVRPLLQGHTARMRGAVELNDGRWLSWSDDGCLRLWDAETGVCTTVLEGHTHWVSGSFQLRDGGLLSWSVDGCLRLWDVATGACTQVLEGHASSVRGALELRGGRLLSWSDDGCLRLWDVATGACTQVLEGHASSVRGALELRGGRLLSWSDDGCLRLWDVATGACTQVLEGHASSVRGATELKDGGLVSWSADGCLRLWDALTGSCTRVLEGHGSSVRGATELKEGGLVSWSADGCLRLWDTNTAACTALFEGHTSPVKGVLELTDGRLLSWSSDSNLRLWDAGRGARTAVLEDHPSAARGALELRDGRLLSWTADSADRTLRIWDPVTGTCKGVLKGHTNRVRGALELRDGSLLSWSADRTLLIWDSATGACERVLEGHASPVRGALELRDGRVLSWSADRTLRIWDPATGVCRLLLKGYTGRVTGALELRDGRLLSWSDDGALRLWETATGVCTVVREGHASSVRGALELRDGHLLSWSDDRNLRLGNPLTGARTMMLKGHTSSVRGALELRDGRLLSWSDDRTLRIWARDSAASTLVLKGHMGSVGGAFELQDNGLLSWSEDGGLRLWEQGSGACTAVFELASRCLSVALGSGVVTCTFLDGICTLLTSTPEKIHGTWWSLSPSDEATVIRRDSSAVVFRRGAPTIIAAAKDGSI